MSNSSDFLMTHALSLFLSDRPDVDRYHFQVRSRSLPDPRGEEELHGRLEKGPRPNRIHLDAAFYLGSQGLTMIMHTGLFDIEKGRFQTK